MLKNYTTKDMKVDEVKEKQEYFFPPQDEFEAIVVVASNFEEARKEWLKNRIKKSIFNIS
jgi:hypothetical protein